jgi:hypothetical protein
MSKRQSPRLISKKRDASTALNFDIEDDDRTEYDADILGGLGDASVERGKDDDDSFASDDDDDVADEEVADEEVDDDAAAIEDEDDGGIVVADGPVVFDEFNIPNTVEHFRMGGRHQVFGFYRQLVKPFKAGRKNLGIICVLCVKALDGTDFDQWTWVKSARVFTNNTTNLLSHLEKQHADEPSVKDLMLSKKKKKGSVEGTPATVSSRGSTRVPSSIAVTMKKSAVEVMKRDVYRWLVASGTPFLKTQAPSFRRIFGTQLSGAAKFVGLSRQTFNSMLDDDYTSFTHCVGTKLRECEDRYFGMRFVDVHHDMFQGPDGNNYLGASCSFIHDFHLHILSLNLTLNNKTHGSEYNAEVLDDNLKADYGFDFSKIARTVVSDTTNAATKVAEYFSEDAEQVNCEMHQLNTAMKYGFGLLENTRSSIFLDANNQKVKLANGKWMRVSEIVTPGGAFPEGKELIKKLSSIATYFDHPQRLERLRVVQQHYNVPVGSPSRPGSTRVSSIHKLLSQSLYFYWSLQRFCEEASTSPSNEDKEFVTDFQQITEQDWATVQEIEALSVSVAKYSMFEAQMSRIIAPWIQYMRKKVRELLRKDSVQVLSYNDRPRAAITYREFKVKRSPRVFASCSTDSKKCSSRLLKQVDARLPNQTAESVLVVFLDIRSASIVKTIIENDVYACTIPGR